VVGLYQENSEKNSRKFFKRVL